MGRIANIDWRPIFTAACIHFEKEYKIRLRIDTDILDELELHVEKTLQHYQLTGPNVAKVAGHVCFWLRRLKPIHHHPNSRNKNTAINEEVALWVALSICADWHDDHSRQPIKQVPMRILKDWVTSLRINAHSPHALAIAFELIASDH